MSVLEFRPEGIYCSQGDFYIDPWRPVERALITHGHSDHARYGSKKYLCTDIAAPVIRHRLGDVKIETISYEEEIKNIVIPKSCIHSRAFSGLGTKETNVLFSLRAASPTEINAVLSSSEF